MSHESMDTGPIQSSTLASENLERGQRLEQAGSVATALDVYRVALAEAQSIYEQARSRIHIARALRALGKLDEAMTEARIGHRLADAARADDLAAEAMNVEINVHLQLGEIDEADTLASCALQRARSPRIRGITLQSLGRIAVQRADFAAAGRRFNESIRIFRDADNELGMAIALTNASVAAREDGDAERALELSADAAALCRRLNALDPLFAALQVQAGALVSLGKLDEAEVLLTEALGYFTTARNPIRQAECLEIMGEMSELRPDHTDTAARCYARAREIAAAAGDRMLVKRLTERMAKKTDDDREGPELPWSY